MLTNSSAWAWTLHLIELRAQPITHTHPQHFSSRGASEVMLSGTLSAGWPRLPAYADYLGLGGWPQLPSPAHLRWPPQPKRSRPAARPSGPGWPPGSPSIGAGRHSAGRASGRLSLESPRDRAATPAKPPLQLLAGPQEGQAAPSQGQEELENHHQPGPNPTPTHHRPAPSAPGLLRRHRPPHLRISLEATEPGRQRSACLQSTETRSGRNLRPTHTRCRLNLRPMREDRPIV